MRYLIAAFLARPDWPLFRLVPWNAVAVVAAAAAGFYDPSIWATAGVGEAIYLLTMASNPGFQQWLDMRRQVTAREDDAPTRQRLLSGLGGAARQKYVRLEEKRAKIEKITREQNSDDLLMESNQAALRRLSWLFLQLLDAQRDLRAGTRAEPKELQTQVDALERELDALDPDAAVRTSKEATLRLLRERLRNLGDRDASLTEIEADLARIEAQFDLALEDAALRDRPVTISANIELTSHMLTNLGDPLSTGDEDSQATTSPRLMQ